MVEPWSAGNYGTEPAEDKGRRLMRALCFVRSEAKDNGYARPLDGVVAVVDLNKMEVLRVEDYGVVPLPPEAGNWAREYVRKFRGGPQAAGDRPARRAELHGRRPRGPLAELAVPHRLHAARGAGAAHRQLTDDEGEERPVLHRASVCEMVVPYGDPGEQYYRKNAFDIGEYGIGTLANSLDARLRLPGADPLLRRRHARQPRQGRHAQERRLPARGGRTACCGSTPTGGPTRSEVRRSRRLSVSFIATVGNYEYGFYWHFYQDGSLQCEVKLTGIMNTTALKPGEKSAYGVEVAPRLNAPFHQHIFAARLDTCVDGEKNSVYEVNTRAPAARARTTRTATPSAPRRRCWRRRRQAQRSVNARHGPLLADRQPGQQEPAGRAGRLPPRAGRELPAVRAARRRGDAPGRLRRAPSVGDALSPRRSAIRPATTPTSTPAATACRSGPRPTGRSRTPTWCVWYVFSHMHVPRPEDWPVMPVCSIGFQLKPDGFFARNPAMDLPPPA